MRLIHCHNPLQESDLELLTAMLSGVESCLVLRQSAIQTLANSTVMQTLLANTAVYSLNDTNHLIETTEMGSASPINQHQFVQLCVKAEQLIAWK